MTARIDEGILLLARGLGVGLAPKAPGTAGSLLGIPLFLMVQGQGWPPVAVGALVAVFVALARRAE